MNNRNYISIIFILLSIVCTGQSIMTVEVLDMSENPIVFASITAILENDSKSYFTDNNGKLLIDLSSENIDGGEVIHFIVNHKDYTRETNIYTVKNQSNYVEIKLNRKESPIMKVIPLVSDSVVATKILIIPFTNKTEYPNIDYSGILYEQLSYVSRINESNWIVKYAESFIANDAIEEYEFQNILEKHKYDIVIYGSYAVIGNKEFINIKYQCAEFKDLNKLDPAFKKMELEHVAGGQISLALNNSIIYLDAIISLNDHRIDLLGNLLFDAFLNIETKDSTVLSSLQEFGSLMKIGMDILNAEEEVILEKCDHHCKYDLAVKSINETKDLSEEKRFFYISKLAEIYKEITIYEEALVKKKLPRTLDKK